MCEDIIDFEEQCYRSLIKRMEEDFSYKRKVNHTSDFSTIPLIKKDGTIPFWVVFHWFGTLKYTKEEAKRILSELKKRKLIVISPYNGVKLYKL